MQQKITSLLFDLDGTLIDTNELIITSYLHTLEQYFPGEFQREDVLPFMGPSLFDVFQGLDPEKAEEMVDVYRKHNIEHHDLLVKEFDGVFETIRTLHENGYKLAIVSTKKRDTVLKGLELTNLKPFFEAIITMDDVEKLKPDPEPLNKAMALLDSKPEETMMIGDNYHDILGGKNAGTITCGVAWSLKGKDHLLSYHPDYMLDKMSDLLPIIGVHPQ
ncbi:pyrophosphatase PpaX [Lederbergia sp. NSJ-179]|uniref:pyrophosphatase PpaX n=1 Tax=Lederbergia sp. NSJ-179 TaxID=2931402 RepID=UPI001FD3CB32|nr:pyrophosphatase PpaX [Lederbergia sp. NSJ-179]MCJ7840213.1 pyrophosphatase PpaX [Lederbergia sp. NSJ-179]